MKKAYRLSEDIRCVNNVSPGDINSQNRTAADEEQDRRCKKGLIQQGWHEISIRAENRI